MKPSYFENFLKVSWISLDYIWHHLLCAIKSVGYVKDIPFRNLLVKTEVNNLFLFWSNSILMTAQYFARQSQHLSKNDDIRKMLWHHLFFQQAQDIPYVMQIMLCKLCAKFHSNIICGMVEKYRKVVLLLHGKWGLKSACRVQLKTTRRQITLDFEFILELYLA